MPPRSILVPTSGLTRLSATWKVAKRKKGKSTAREPCSPVSYSYLAQFSRRSRKIFVSQPEIVKCQTSRRAGIRDKTSVEYGVLTIVVTTYEYIIVRNCLVRAIANADDIKDPQPGPPSFDGSIRENDQPE